MERRIFAARRLAWCLHNAVRVRSILATVPAAAFALAAACGGQVDDARCIDGSSSQPLSLKCFQKTLATDADGRVPCRVFRLFPAGISACDCSAPGHSLPTTIPEVVRTAPFRSGQCGDDPCCSDQCFCEIEQLSGAELTACQWQKNPVPEPAGFCDVDPERGVGASAITAPCPVTDRRLMRTLGLGANYSLIVSCQGDVVSSQN